MKKLILSMICALLASAIGSIAAVYITVDNALNITMKGNAGYGNTVSLHDGLNEFSADDFPVEEQPYLVEATNYATIESLTINGILQSVSMGTNNGYRFGVNDGDEIVIVTSGASQEATISFSPDKMNTVKVSYDGQSVMNPTNISVTKGTELTIAPLPGYEIYPSCMYGRVADNGDGTFRFVADNDDTIWSTSSVNGIGAELNLDFADNVEVSFGSGLDQYYLAGLSNGKNDIATDESHLPLNIAAANGASVLSVTVGGAAMNPSHDGAWHLGLTGDDVIVVETQGRELDVTFYNYGSVGLENFNITVDGRKVDASGDQFATKGHLGDEIVVAPLPGTSIDYVSPGTPLPDGSYSIVLSEYNNNIYISGQKETGVTINVDDASRVVVRPLGGYADPLELANGDNKFALEDLAMPLNVNATDGNRIISVVCDGETITAGSNGSYNVSPGEGSRINITSEVIPQEISVTLNLGENWEKVGVTLDGEPLEITSESSVVSVVPGSVFAFTPVKGYGLVSVLAPGNEVSGSDYGYRVVADNPGLISVVCQKLTAQEGYAIVTIDSNVQMWYSELDGNGTFQRYLDTENAWEVKIGSTISVYTFTEALFFNSVTANGEPVEADPDDRKSYHVPVSGDTEIVIDAYKKILISTERVVNPDNMTTIGELYVKDGDSKVTSYYASPGEVVEFVPEPAKGYKFDYISMIYPEGRDEQFTTSYTVSQEDLDNYELLVFRGTYSLEDETRTLFCVEGNTTQMTVDGSYIKMGEVWPLDEDGNSHLNVLAYENETIDFEVITEPGFEFTNLSLFYDSEKVLDKPYVVDSQDADSHNVISVVGIFSINSGGVTATGAGEDSGLAYHKATKELVSNQPIALYDVAGTQVGYSAEGNLRLDGYAGGVYIAVSGNRTIKFTLR